MMLAQLAFAIVHGASRETKTGGLCFFGLLSSFSSETEFTKFVSEETATPPSQHNSGRRRIPMPLKSCCLVRLSSGGLGALLMRSSHYLRARGDTFAVVPLCEPPGPAGYQW